MKQKRNYLFLFSLLVVCLTVINFSGALKISVNILDGVNVHQARLHSLYLTEWFDEDTAEPGQYLAWLKTNNNHILVSNGLLVWNTNKIEWSSMVTIGWWDNNKIQNSKNSWIAGWMANTISKWDNSVIWWWSSNTIEWSDAVIAWWSNNKATTWGVVVWWSDNEALNNGVVFWWKWNKADWFNSLVLWNWSEWGKWSFAWNGKANDYSAYIWAKNWVLIWTYDPIDWVNLVVNWAIKLWWETKADWVPWEIRVVWWCFYAYDGEYWHVINQSWKSGCTLLPAADTCEFWAVHLQEWDVVTAFKDPISASCSSIDVSCIGWNLVGIRGERDYIYPYCHELEL